MLHFIPVLERLTFVFTYGTSLGQVVATPVHIGISRACNSTLICKYLNNTPTHSIMMITQEDYDRIQAEIDKVREDLDYVRDGFAQARAMLHSKK